MTISTHIYANLSPIERIRAAVSATARDDHTELQILKETCPKMAFMITDPAYTQGMVNLFSLMLLMEFELAKFALDFQTARLQQGEKEAYVQNCALIGAASVVAAMDQLLSEMGIDPQAMAKTNLPRHPYVHATIRMSEGEADPEIVEANLQAMREILAT